MKVMIGISNHHVHVTEEDFKILFGENARLDSVKELKQPGQFASDKRVDVQSENGVLTGLRILGPCRDYTQVELSQTDCRNLKISCPVRSSGDLNDAMEITLVGPCGKVTCTCAIIADRHIHITHEDREKLGLLEVTEVQVSVLTSKGGIFHHVQIKEAPNSCFEMHIDTDDANGFLIENGMEGDILL